MQEFKGVAVEDRDDGAGEVGGRGESRKVEIEEKENRYLTVTTSSTKQTLNRLQGR